MNYKLIALDLDGTLTNDDKIITPKTYDALMRAQQQGIRLILASGRPPYGMRPLAEQLHMAEYGGMLLCYNGGHIEELTPANSKDNTTSQIHGKVLVEVQLAEEYLPQLHQWQEESGMTLMSYYEDHIYTEYPGNKYVHQSSKNNNMSIIKLDDFVRDMPRPINKCLMVGDPAIVPEWEEKMQKAMEGKMNIMHSTPYFIELLPLGIDKGIALEKLLPQLGMTPDNLMAFGDSFNDIGMLQYAGMGIAMANAEPEVKAVADYVTLSNEEDGVAAALQHFLR